jgi:hypothetical protein
VRSETSKPSLKKLTVNSRSAPRRILFDYPLDQRSKLGIDLWPATTPCLRAEAPEQTKACTMPGDHGLWFHKDEGLAPCSPDAAEQRSKRFDPGFAAEGEELFVGVRPTAYLWRNSEAIAEMRRAESMDPLSLIISADMADALLVARLHDESIQQRRQTIDMNPTT